jgi:hypothetical protein
MADAEEDGALSGLEVAERAAFLVPPDDLQLHVLGGKLSLEGLDGLESEGAAGDVGLVEFDGGINREFQCEFRRRELGAVAVDVGVGAQHLTEEGEEGSHPEGKPTFSGYTSRKGG